MKSSNQYINESVFRVNTKYAELQNKTKELFFRCLDENRDFEYFKEEVEKIWGNIDHKFFQEELNAYEEIIHEQNISGRKIIEVEEKDMSTMLFALVPLSVILRTEERFVKIKEREYKNSLKSYAYKTAKDEYLKLKVAKYNNQVVPYYSTKTNQVIRYVQPSTYNAMIHNTNLTRSGWNTTIKDAERTNNSYFWIPPHSFSCPYCASHQGKILTKRDLEYYIGMEAQERSGDILHPNCKCTLTIYDNNTKLVQPKYNSAELEEQYEIRQKVNSLTLKKEEILTDIKIQKRLGNQDSVDELNQQRNKINKSIRELKEALPTAELKKQVVAINR